MWSRASPDHCDSPSPLPTRTPLSFLFKRHSRQISVFRPFFSCCADEAAAAVSLQRQKALPVTETVFSSGECVCRTNENLSYCICTELETMSYCPFSMFVIMLLKGNIFKENLSKAAIAIHFYFNFFLLFIHELQHVMLS